MYAREKNLAGLLGIWWLIPVIPAIWREEIRKIMV
jgi:hypothetical protein